MKKKAIELSIFATTLAICSCCGTSKGKDPADTLGFSAQQASVALPQTDKEKVYSSIYYERKGGGNIGYGIIQEGDSLRFQVDQMNFRPAALQFTLPKSRIDSNVIALMDSLLLGEVNIGEPDTAPKNGPVMMGGTWTYAYLLQDSAKTPVYGKKIIETIGNTEETVRSEIEARMGK